jgi:hypothetical protein
MKDEECHSLNSVDRYFYESVIMHRTAVGWKARLFERVGGFLLCMHINALVMFNVLYYN